MPDRIIAVDWSGARKNPGKTIWLAEFVDGSPKDLLNGLDRQQVIDYLKAKRQISSSLVVGLDFAFSCPAWFLSKWQCATASDFWDVVKEHGEEWLGVCPNPFWKKKRPPTEAGTPFRKTEDQLRQRGLLPKSVFQLVGPGHVGTGSLRGMPFLIDLANSGFAIWPFQDATSQVVIEIYPRVLTERVIKRVIKGNAGHRRTCLSDSLFSKLPEDWHAKACCSEDAFDAAISAFVMNCHRNSFSSLKRATDSAFLLEGIIWDPPRSN